MSTAIKDALGLHAMAYDAAGTMGTGGRQRVDSTLETVKYMCLTSHAYFKTLIVRVATHFACYFSVSPSHPHIFILIHHLPLSCYFFRRFVGALLVPSLFLFTVKSVDSGVLGSGFALKRSPIQWTGCEPSCSMTSLAAFVSGTSVAS